MLDWQPTTILTAPGLDGQPALLVRSKDRRGREILLLICFRHGVGGPVTPRIKRIRADLGGEVAKTLATAHLRRLLMRERRARAGAEKKRAGEAP